MRACEVLRGWLYRIDLVNPVYLVNPVKQLDRINKIRMIYKILINDCPNHSRTLLSTAT